MSVNQIDDIIDQTLDQLYLEELNSNETIRILTEGKVINFVEHFDGINSCIRNFTNKIDKSKIQELVNSKENTQRILDIITRYVAYYIFLYIGFYYTGTFKDFRNNLIQFSKLQEKSLYSIINFFDTENNYRILSFYKMMRDVMKIILMTDLQKKSIDVNEKKDALAFLDKIGENNVNEYFLIVTPDPEKDDDATIQLNVHSIIKTIVFGELYQFQERHVIFSILSEIEENESEFTYIDIVVMADTFDFDSIRKIFLGYKGDTEKMANNLFELLNTSDLDNLIEYRDNEKINRLIDFYGVIPIVDDFLRYHKDSIKLEGSEPVPIIFSNTASKQNIQLLLKSQQRKKKENTKAQMIINKIDAIQRLYSSNVKNNPAIYNKIKQLFFEPYIHRKMVLHNYLEELEILNKMHKMETYITSIDEYYLELLYAINHAYFNFKDFHKYGNHVNIETGKTINMLRYCNIEYLNKGTPDMLDVRTGAINSSINLVGLSLGPFNGNYIQCITKDKLIDIRTITINYTKNKEKKSIISNNGYKMFIKCFKRFYVDTITVLRDPKISIIVDTEKIKILNPDLFDRIIYWVYDVTTDIYKSKTYELGSQKSLLAGISDSETENEIDFQEKIKQMNSDLYDRIVKTLKTKLSTLIRQHSSFTIFETYTLIYLFSNIYGLNMSEKEVNIIIRENYVWEKIDKVNITQISEKNIIPNPEINLPARAKPIVVKIDISDPLHPKSAKAINKRMDQEMPEDVANFGEFIENSRCKHEIDWDDIVKLYESGDAYKSAINRFIAMYAIQSNDSSFVCKICGQTLQVLQYVQDGKFDNNVQKYVSSYSSSDIKLKDMKEYVAYVKTLKHLKKSTKRISFLMGINVVSGSGPMVKQKQTSLTKQIVDLLIKHNQIVLRRNIDNDARLDFYAKKFGIDKRFSSVYFFQLNDNLFNPEQRQVIQADADVRKLEINNITLYVSLIILTELNGPQIMMMNTDKFLNIYFFDKYGRRLFEGLLLKRNITDDETVPILNHPVLCYCIYVIAYVLYTYLIWMFASDEKTKKTFNPAILKNIIHSLCELLNSILTECGIQNIGGTINDYVYLLFSNKFYSQLNGIYSDNSIISILRKLHSKYSDAPTKAVTVDKVKTNYIDGNWHIVSTPYKITVFKVSNGIAYDKPSEIEFPYDKTITSEIICESGDFHSWIWKNQDLVCRKCGALYSKVDTVEDKTIVNYYFFQDKTLKKECEKEMGNKESPFFDICNNHKDGSFSHTDIDKFNTISEKEKLNRIEGQMTNNIEQRKILDTRTSKNEALIESLYTEVNKKYDKTYGIINEIVDSFVKIIAGLLGSKTNLNIYEETAPDQGKPIIEKNPYPIYLNDDVYIIDHSYDKTPLPTPIVMLESENKILFKENHPFFKTDVYYYADNRTVQVNVFYDAITFKLLGYKAKHKDYILYEKSNQFLKVNQSIKNKLLVFSYRNKYINITDAINKTKLDDINLTYYEIINELIEKHILTTRNTIDIISRMLYKIKNYVAVQKGAIFLESTKEIDKLIDKYAGIFSNKISLGKDDDAFDDWRFIRNMFKHQKIDWSKTNVLSSIHKNGVFTYISTEMINYYDVASTVMMYYLVGQLSKILDSNPEKVTKTNITKLYIDLINYVYSINNIDEIKNTSDIRRFEYILKGSSIAIDLLRRGQGIAAAEKMEKQLINLEAEQTIEEIVGEPVGETNDGEEIDSDDLEDIREEADALDVEAGEYDDDDNVEYESE
jgi:hypothetical protein